MPLTPYQDLIDKAALEHDVDPALVRAIILQESGGDPRAMGPVIEFGPEKGARAGGIMQFTPETAKAYGIDPFKPEEAIPAGVKLLASHLARTKNADEAVLSYHGGPDPKNWGPQTRAYLEAVKTRYGMGGSIVPSTSGAFDRFLSGEAEKSSADFEKFLSGEGAAQGPVDVSRVVDIPKPDENKFGPTIEADHGSLVQRYAPNFMKGPWNPAVAFASGVTQGFAPELMGALSAIKQKGLSEAFKERPQGSYAEQAAGAYRNAREQFAKENPATSIGAEVAGSMASAVPLMATGAGLALKGAQAAAPATTRAIQAALEASKAFKVLGRAAGGAAEGAFGGALSSQLHEETPVKDQALTGAVIGSALRPAFGALGDALTPQRVSEGVNKLAQAAERMGINITGPMLTDSRFIRMLNSALKDIPFTGAGKAEEAADTAVTRAVSKTFGADLPQLTQEGMAKAKKDLGKAFDAFAEGKAFDLTGTVGDKLVNDLSGILTSAKNVLNDATIGPVENQLKGLGKYIASGKLTGEQYRALTSHGSDLSLLEKDANSAVANYAHKIRNALDDVMEASLPAEEVAAFKTLRSQYKAFKAIEPLAVKGQLREGGTLDPALLAGRLPVVYKDMATRGTGNDLGDLAAIGQQFLKEPPSSGSAQRMWINGILGGASGLGVLGGAVMKDPYIALGPALTVAGTGLLGRGVNAAINSNWYKNKLLGSVVPEADKLFPYVGMTNPIISGAVPLANEQRIRP